MAYTKKNVKPADTVIEVSESVETKPEKKKFDKEDTITCKSITDGLLLVTGDKSGILYRWPDYGATEEVEYQDLVYMVRAKNPAVFKPRFVIENEDFIAEYPELNKLYDTLYSIDDLKDVLKLPVSQMRKMITEQLPVGAVDAIKGLAASMIMNGSLDSTAKIKALDEIFGTHLLLTLAQG